MKSTEPRTAKPAAVACPHCGKPVSWDAASIYKPFCSERCRLIDLGGWLSERHAIPDDAGPAAEEDTAD